MFKFFRQPDWLVLLLTLMIAFLGLVVIKSIAPSLFSQQIISLFLGLILFFVFSQIDIQNYPRLIWPIYFACLGFLALTLLVGQATRGSIRWLEIGSLRLQSSEIVKPFLIIFFAFFFADEILTLKRFVWGFLFLALPFVLIFLQPDLGSSLVLVVFWFGIIFAKGIKGKWLAVIGGLFLVCLPAIWFFLKDYQKERLLTFLNPQHDPLGSGFNVIQSMIAVGSGQFFGRGLGRGTQSHLRFLPERQTDFIFASLAEELGFLGSLILLVLFFLLLLRLLNLARNQSKESAFLINIGIFSLIFAQFMVNLGMSLGILPVTGITLPLVSYGGSSLISTMIVLGLAAGLSQSKEGKQAVEIR